MKKSIKYIPVYLILLSAVISFTAGCGYHNANVYSGPEKKIYIVDWKNRTSTLTLDSDIYRSLFSWFQNSPNIEVVTSRSSADLIMAGEIISLDLPSLSYNDGTTSEVQVNLRVRYIIKDITTNEILIEVPNEIWTDEYVLNSTSATTASSESAAIATIVDDLTKSIYRKTLRKLNNPN